MRKWRIAAIATATFAACSPFSASSEPPPSGVGSTSGADASAAPDASRPSSGLPTGAGVAPFASCKDAPANLFCDDFSSGNWSNWTYPSFTNPDIHDAPNAKAHFDSPPGAPSPPVAVFEFPDRATASCGYAWSDIQLDLTASPVDKVTVAFDLRLVDANASGDKEAVGLVLLRDGANVVIQNYLMVRDPAHATILEQWKADGGQTSTSHVVGDLSDRQWVRVELALDAKARHGGVALGGATGSVWDFGSTSFGSQIAKVEVGIGYSCSLVGGVAQYDNVLVTSN